jgi:hypothetical protein
MPKKKLSITEACSDQKACTAQKVLVFLLKPEKSKNYII